LKVRRKKLDPSGLNSTVKSPSIARMIVNVGDKAGHDVGVKTSQSWMI
jgi:hypothetical protein